MKLSRHMIDTTFRRRRCDEIRLKRLETAAARLRAGGCPGRPPEEPRTAQCDSLGECCTLDTLAVKGGDIARYGSHGPTLSATRSGRALDYVIDHPEDNERGKLMELIKEGKI